MVAMIKRCCDKRDERVWKLVGAMQGFGFDDSMSRRYLSEKFPEMLPDLSRWKFHREAVAGNS